MVHKNGKTIESDIFEVKEDVLYAKYETRIDQAASEWWATFIFPKDVVKKILDFGRRTKQQDYDNQDKPVAWFELGDNTSLQYVFEDSCTFQDTVKQFIIKDTQFKYEDFDVKNVAIKYQYSSNECACIRTLFVGSKILHPRSMSDNMVEYTFMKLASAAQDVFANLSLVLVESDLAQPLVDDSEATHSTHTQNARN